MYDAELLRERGGCPDCGAEPGESCDCVPELEDDDGCCRYCNGDRWILADCTDDVCCCLHPEEEHGSIPCPACNFQGELR